MSYDEARHFADSWGLLFMIVIFVMMIAWALRPGAKEHHDQASKLIFDEDTADKDAQDG